MISALVRAAGLATEPVPAVAAVLATVPVTTTAFATALVAAFATACLVASLGCASPPDPASARIIDFDLGAIDEQGLLVTGDSSVAVHYEFCVPDVDRLLDLVTDIDTTATLSSSPGRMGCGEEQKLVIGSTHQPGWRAVLDRLAALPFVTRIARTDWE